MHSSFKRARGATTHFRRKIPADIAIRLESREIIRSIGRTTPGETRRTITRFWLLTEVAFVYVRANPDLDKEAIRRVIAKALDQVDDHVDDTLAFVGREATKSPFDEPANVAPRMAGASLAARSALDRCAVDHAIPIGQRLGEAALGRFVSFDEREQRRLARGVYEAIAVGAEQAEASFRKIGDRRPAAAAGLIEKGTREVSSQQTYWRV